MRVEDLERSIRTVTGEMNNADRMRKKYVPHQEGELLWQEAVEEKRRIHRSCYTVAFPNRDVRPLLSIRGLKAAPKSCAPLFPLFLPSQRMEV